MTQPPSTPPQQGTPPPGVPRPPAPTSLPHPYGPSPSPPAPPGYRWAGYRPPQPTLAPNGAPLAEFGDRFLAYLIDYVILFAVTVLVWLPAMAYQFSVMRSWLNELEARYPSSPAPGGVAPQPEPAEVLADYFRVFGRLLWVYLAVFVVTLLVYYVYRVELMFRTGQTVGKRVMGLRVVPLDPRATLTRGVAVRRWLFDSVAVQVVPLLFLLDGLWQLWDQPFRQCLHDKVAGTTVVKVAS